jgi:hypothetical protein
MPTPTGVGDLQRQRERLLADLAALGDPRPGSLTERYRKYSTRRPALDCGQRSRARS